jgi:hypothetical protein
VSSRSYFFWAFLAARLALKLAKRPMGGLWLG